jgi:hypothetical protein
MQIKETKFKGEQKWNTLKQNFALELLKSSTDAEKHHSPYVLQWIISDILYKSECASRKE